MFTVLERYTSRKQSIGSMELTQFKIIIKIGQTCLIRSTRVKYLWYNLVGMEIYILALVHGLDRFLKPLKKDLFHSGAR